MKVRLSILCFALFAIFPQAVFAADCGTQIGKTDLTAYPNVRVAFTSCDDQVPNFVVHENGSQIYNVSVHSGPVGQNIDNPQNEIIMLFDASKSMDGAKFEYAQDAAKALLDQAGSKDRIGLMSFGETVNLLSGPTTDLDTVRNDLGTIQTSEGTRLFDAVGAATKDFHADATRRMLVIVTDGADTGSKTTENQAIVLARQAGVEIYSVGIQSTGPVLARLSQKTGGAFENVTDASELSNTYQTLGQKLLRSYWFDYQSPHAAGDHVRVRITDDSGTATNVSYVAPTVKVVAKKDATLKTTPAHKPLLHVPSGGLGIVLIAIPLALLVGFVTMLLLGRSSRPRQAQRILDYTARTHLAPAEARADRSLLHPIYALTEGALGTSNLFRRFRALIDQANLPLREVELLYMILSGSLIGFFIGLLRGGPLLLILTPLFASLPYLWVRHRAHSRKKSFETQLPDMLGMIASSLRAGHSFNQSLKAAARDAASPMSEELERVLTESRLGMPLEAALEEMATRMDSDDFDFAVTTVNIQRTVGGSLSEILNMVADTVRHRQQFRKKVKALTSMGTLSSYVLLGLPVAMMGLLTIVNPHYMTPLFQTSVGHLMLILMLFLMGLGTWACRKIVNVKV